jgi:type I restriction enzyme S subunit
MKAPQPLLKTLAGGRGVFRGPIFSRMFVDDPSRGEPYVSARDIVTSNVQPAAFLSRRHGRLLQDLRLHEGMILVTCSGMNLGSVIWTRKELAGLVASHDLIRIEPDSKAAPPGYLFAFLSSRHGHALIRKQIYGGHIKHIEPEHIGGLPVPRLGASLEGSVDKLIAQATKLRDQASASQRRAIERVHELLEWKQVPTTNIASASASALQRRMDAFHHLPKVAAARKSLGRRAAATLGKKVESVFEPNRGPRLKVDDPALGVPFLSSSEVFRLDPVGEYSISKARTPNVEKLLVSERDLLLPRSGQLGGIIGRAVLPLPTYYGHAASEHLVRVRCRSKADACFLWAVFASEPGYLATIGTAFGSSIPSLDTDLLGEMQVPWFDDATRAELTKLVASAVEANTQAIHAERKAMRMVEEAIEKGVPN